MRHRRLGSTPAEHATTARKLVKMVEDGAKSAQRGTCGIRFTSLVDANDKAGQLWAHAFRAGGKTAKGALASKTVSTKLAVRIYDAIDAVKQANQRYRRDCIKQGPS